MDASAGHTTRRTQGHCVSHYLYYRSASFGTRDPVVLGAIAKVAPSWLTDDPSCSRFRTDAIYNEIRRLDRARLLAAISSRLDQPPERTDSTT